jgi:hypothetical protein
MLTGRVIFGDEDVRLTFNDRVRGDTLVNARLAQIGLAGDVAKVLSHSMIARADDRIATAPELFEHLREALKVRAPTSIAPFPIEPSAQQMQQMHHQHQQQQQNQHQQQLPPPPLPVALALEVEASGSEGAPLVQPAPERVTHYGERRVRFVQVHEKLDLSFVDREGGHVRVRVTMLPGAAGAQQKLNVKGLTCFVARRGQRPTPALTVTTDGSADLVSSTRVTLGELTWSFGQATPEGRVFVVDGRQLLVPYSEGHLAIALLLSPGNDLVVMCRR